MKIPALLTAMLATATLCAQDGPEALSGPKGIIVFVGNDVPRTDGPVKSYRIERRTGTEEAYTRVAELTPVASAKELRKALEQAAKLFPWPVQVDRIPVEELYDRITSKGTRSGLGAFATHTPVLLATGLAWADTDVRTGNRYQYRVVDTESGKARSTVPVTHAPAMNTVRFKPMSARYAETDRRMDLLWWPEEGQRPATLRLQRSENDGPFEEVTALLEVMRFGDTLLYAMADTTVRRYQLYRYALSTYDMAGNAGPANDTLITAALDPVQMPMPTSLNATGDSSGRGIRIDWVLPNAPLVKQLTLMRSTNSEDGFEPVAVLTPDRGSYLDEEVGPARSYFYHFVLEYKTQARTMRSHSFASVVHDPTPPMATNWLNAETSEQGVRLHWVHTGANVSGFMVHRGVGDQAMRQISTTLHGQGAGEYSWTDTTTIPGSTHRYMVQAISTSHVMGIPSDTVEAWPQAPPAPPPAPGALIVQVDGEVGIVSWEDLEARGEHIAGYHLLRDRGGSSDTLFVPVNFLIDTLPPTGTTTYRVMAFSLHGLHSVPGPVATAARNVPPPAPPGTVIARNEEQRVVLTWEPALGSDVARYDVYRAVRGAAPVKVGAVDAAQEPRFVDAAPMPGQRNLYHLRTVSSLGAESSDSRVAGVDR